MSPANPSRRLTPAELMDRWLPRAVLTAAVLAAAVAVSPNVADPDLWGHVQYGRDLIADGLPATTTYSFTSQGYRWINHENLAELLMAGGAALGPAALMIGKCLLGVLVIALVARSAWRQGAGLMVTCGVALLLAVNMSYHWSIRPQILSFVYYALLLQLLSFAFAGWEGRWQLTNRSEELLEYSTERLRYLWLAAPLFCLWANSHGGFVAGLLIFIAYIMLRAVEAVCRRGWDSAPLLKQFAAVLVAACAATLVNPYGYRLHGWLLHSLGQARPEITEWHPADLTSPLSIPLWILMAVFCLSMLLTRRSRDFTHLIILGVTMWQAMTHQRHIPFFAIAFGFWMPVHVQSWLRRWGVSDDSTTDVSDVPAPMRWALCGGLLLAFALLGYKLHGRLREVRVKRKDFPVSAVQYMANEQLGGNLVVTFNWAQYLIGAFGPERPELPQVRVAFDGRFRTCYSQELVDMHFDFILGDIGPQARCRGADSPPFDEDRVLEYGQRELGRPDLVLINRFQPHGELVMRRQRERWVLLYQDQTAQLWGRSERYDDPCSPFYVPPERRRISDQPQQGSVPWPALPKPPSRQPLLASQ